jgi:hypothetical protein
MNMCGISVTAHTCVADPASLPTTDMMPWYAPASRMVVSYEAKSPSAILDISEGFATGIRSSPVGFEANRILGAHHHPRRGPPLLLLLKLVDINPVATPCPAPVRPSSLNTPTSSTTPKRFRGTYLRRSLEILIVFVVEVRLIHHHQPALRRLSLSRRAGL